MVAVVQELSFFFRSDVQRPKKKHNQKDSLGEKEGASEENNHSSGILHSTRSDNASFQDQCFAWISDLSTGLEPIISHLATFGYDRSYMNFIPYSSKKKWAKQYPQARPCVESNKRGKLTIYAHIFPNSIPNHCQPSSGTQEESKSTSATEEKNPSKPRSSLKSIPSGMLLDNERRHLHEEICTYLTWLRSEIGASDVSNDGTTLEKTIGISYDGLRDLISNLKSTLHIKSPNLDSKLAGKESLEIPMLEGTLVDALVEAANNSQCKRKKKEPLSFESLYRRLAAFHAEHDHSNVKRRNDDVNWSFGRLD